MPDPTPTLDPDLTPSVADPAAVTGDVPAPAGPIPPPTGSRYQLGDEIARGGMGAVHRATDTALGREVAVKVLLSGAGAGTTRRFADEAHITGRLQHPAIPPVHDLGTLPDGRPFLAMKLIKGDTLDRLLKTRPDPSADRGRFVAAFEAVCQGVAYAHAHGVIHRDLKPANVMVGAFGEVQVMDWGLAKVLTSRERLVNDSPAPLPAAAVDDTRTAVHVLVASVAADPPADDRTRQGSVMGTPAYMPPEQARGEWHLVDVRSDVFGLGAVLCALLTGEPPFAASESQSTLAAAAAGDVSVAVSRLDGCGADPGLVALCKRCLAPAPADRPINAGAVAAAVAELRQAADERARAAELERERTAVRAAEARKRRRLLTAAGGAVLVVLAAGGLAAGVQWRRAERALATVTTEEQKAQAALAEKTAEERAKAAALALADQRLAAADTARNQTISALRRLGQDIGRWDFETGRPRSPEERAKFAREVQALWQSITDARPDAPDTGALRAEAAERLGDLWIQCGGMTEAEASYRIALTSRRPSEAANRDHPTRVGRVYQKMARLHSDPRNQLALYDKSVEILNEQYVSKSSDNEVKMLLCDALCGRSQALAKLGWPFEAWQVYCEVSRLATNPNHTRWSLEMLVQIAEYGDKDRVLEEMSSLLVLLPKNDAYRLYSLATLYSWISSLQPERREELASQAVSLLRNAYAAGFYMPDKLASDGKLDPIRHRLDFRWLLAKMSANKQRGVKI